MSFAKRAISVAIKLQPLSGTNSPTKFAESGTDSISISGARTSVKVSNAGWIMGTTASVSVWGLTQSLMNQLSTLGMVVTLVPKNTITITAGDADSGMSTVFVGTIVEAFGDYGAAPDVPFRMECRAGAAENAIAYPASSYNGATDVAVVLSTIATRNGWGFENSGVKATLSNPYYSGTSMTQIEAICRDSQTAYALVPGSALGPSLVLAIWPLYGSRAAKAGIPLLSKTTGMIGYPSFTQQGIMVRALFNPAVVYGGQIHVESGIFTTANLLKIKNPSSNWNVLRLDHALDAQVPHGQWMSTILGFNPGFPSPLPKPA